MPVLRSINELTDDTQYFTKLFGQIFGCRFVDYAMIMGLFYQYFSLVITPFLDPPMHISYIPLPVEVAYNACQKSRDTYTILSSFIAAEPPHKHFRGDVDFLYFPARKGTLVIFIESFWGVPTTFGRHVANVV